MKTLAFAKSGGCYVFVCGNRPLDDSEWNDYLTFLKEEFASNSNPRCLVHAEPRGGPTAAQRQRVNELLLPVMKGVKAAVLLSGPIARGIVMAMSWLNPVYRAFDHHQAEEALEFLGIPRADHPAVKQTLAELKQDILR